MYKRYILLSGSVLILAACGGGAVGDSTVAGDSATAGATERRLASDPVVTKPLNSDQSATIPSSASVPEKQASAQEPSSSVVAPVVSAPPAGAPSLQQCEVDLATVAAKLPAALAVIREMPENSWRKINQNTFSSVAQPASLAPDCVSVVGQAGILNAWGSVAYDSNRGDLITFGGGHADYCGNDVYRFRLSTLIWERAGISSQMKRYQKYPNAQYAVPSFGLSQAPATSHMYDGLSFVPIADRMVFFGNRGTEFGGTGAPPLSEVTLEPKTGPWFFDPSKADPNKVVGIDGSAVDPSIKGGYMWENREYATNHPGAYLPVAYGPQTASSATVCENGHDVIYMRTSGPSDVSSGLIKYTINDVANPVLDMLSPVGALSNHMRQADMAVDTKRLVAVLVGDIATRKFAFWNLSTPGTSNPLQGVSSVVDLTGGFTIDETTGMDFDPVRDRFLLWNGVSEVWELKLPDTIPVQPTGWTVRQLISSGGPQGSTPQFTGSGGATGKWKYAPGLDVFLGVRAAPGGDVWVYKPTSWRDPAR